jgi:hypothetical protein
MHTVVQHKKLMKTVMLFIAVSTWEVESPYPYDSLTEIRHIYIALEN